MSDDQEFEPLEDSADDILARMRQLFCKAMHNDFSEERKRALLELVKKYIKILLLILQEMLLIMIITLKR